MGIEVNAIVLQHFLKERYHQQAFIERAMQKMKIDAGCIQILISKYPVVIVLLDQLSLCKLFKLLYRVFQLFVIQQVKMRAHEVVHPLDIVRRFYRQHCGILLKQVNPFHGNTGNTAGSRAG